MTACALFPQPNPCLMSGAHYQINFDQHGFYPRLYKGNAINQWPECTSLSGISPNPGLVSFLMTLALPSLADDI